MDCQHDSGASGPFSLSDVLVVATKRARESQPEELSSGKRYQLDCPGLISILQLESIVEFPIGVEGLTSFCKSVLQI
jgi:hypothetical protein